MSTGIPRCVATSCRPWLASHVVCEKTVLAVLRVRGQTMIRAGVGDTETRGQQRVRRQLEHAILF